jgi:hypothetical protein
MLRFFPGCVKRSGVPMFGKPMVLSQLWLHRVPHHATLYAFSFWSSSYTLVATVCRFSPSQCLALFSVGLRSCKERTSLPYYAESQGLWLGIGRGGGTPASLARSLSSYVVQKGWNSSTIHGTTLRCLGLDAPRDSVIGTCHTHPCLSAQNRGV